MREKQATYLAVQDRRAKNIITWTL